jgi:hypothetical protein
VLDDVIPSELDSVSASSANPKSAKHALLASVIRMLAYRLLMSQYLIGGDALNYSRILYHHGRWVVLEYEDTSCLPRRH